MLDISVLILFFNRPESLAKVFEQVRKAQPARLFLYQDGPRGEKDLPGIQACRDIVAQVDWPCEVHRNYQKKNIGCDPAEYLSQKWAFSMTDKCIVLEDDDIPSVSFFRFCKEMLDRYEHDERISMISGMNYDEQTPIPYDYFFATTFCISGWATWRRVVDQWDETYSFLDDDYNLALLEALIKERRYQKDFVPFCRYHRASGKAYYETIFHAAIFFSNGLSIVPRVNMVTNLGACGEGIHLSGTNDVLPRAYRRIFEMKAHELDFPLRHPRYIIEDVGYKNRMFRIQGWGHPWVKAARSLEELWLNLKKGNFRRIGQAMSARLRKIAGKARWD